MAFSFPRFNHQVSRLIQVFISSTPPPVWEASDMRPCSWLEEGDGLPALGDSHPFPHSSQNTILLVSLDRLHFKARKEIGNDNCMLNNGKLVSNPIGLF